jgi:hypothetical protein
LLIVVRPGNQVTKATFLSIKGSPTNEQPPGLRIIPQDTRLDKLDESPSGIGTLCIHPVGDAVSPPSKIQPMRKVKDLIPHVFGYSTDTVQHDPPRESLPIHVLDPHPISAVLHVSLGRALLGLETPGRLR